MKKFDIPEFYKSDYISQIKVNNVKHDPMKKDFTPIKISKGKLTIYLARHFGFCYGVENAIEIAFKALRDEKEKSIYLINEIIHNPKVNQDLKFAGIKFLHDSEGNELIPLDRLTSNDIVIIPAFGTTLEMEKMLKNKGIEIKTYNTTCPFVEKVWNRSKQISEKGFSIIIHGKPSHEETKASFSHIKNVAPIIIIKDISEAYALGQWILNKNNWSEINSIFENRYCPNFNFEKDLEKIGVVNQTTQLAFETKAIANYFKEILIKKYGLDNIKEHFANTRDTLCYATNDNQTSVIELVKEKADFALVIGGKNSSNTTHLVEICNEKLTTYFIENELSIINNKSILHYNINSKKTEIKELKFSANKELTVLITSGASCPDIIVERVIEKLASIVNL